MLVRLCADQRFDEEQAGTAVGRDLPRRGIPDRDIFDLLVGAEFDCRLDARLPTMRTICSGS